MTEPHPCHRKLLEVLPLLDSSWTLQPQAWAFCRAGTQEGFASWVWGPGQGEVCRRGGQAGETEKQE